MSLLVAEAGLALMALVAVITVASAAIPASFAAGALAGDRYRNLDGLRALCALLVMLAHAKALYNLHFGAGFVLTEGLDPHLSHLAAVGVNMFFQITGFLFWDKVLARDGMLDAPRHFASRIRRLIPAYIVFGCAALLLALSRTGFRLEMDSGDLLRAAIGTFSFGFIDVPGFNKDYQYDATIGITWTLAYEWCFYLSLPLLALLHRRRAFVVAIVGYFVYQFAFPTEWQIANFVGGMTVAAFHRKLSLRRWFDARPSVTVGGLAFALLAAAFALDIPLVEVPVHALLLYLAVATPHLSRLLQQRGLVLIGKASYSVYLLHCLLMYHAFWGLKQFGIAGGWTLPVLWLVLASFGVVVVAFSALNYRLVERPFMERARRRAAGNGEALVEATLR